jgi:hypothetical protein
MDLLLQLKLLIVLLLLLKINDAAVTNAKLGADSVNGSKIADDSIDSEHYVDGSIDTAHIANSQITTAKIADSNVTNAKLATDSVTTAKITNLNVTSGKIADASITNSKIASDAVDGTKIADDSINSEHYVDGSIDTQHIADSQITTAKIADSNITTSKIADSNITTSKIANDAVTADKIADAVIVTNAEASGHTPNDTTFFTTSASDGRYFRQDSSETISSGDTWSGSDSYIATTAAIDARIIDLVDDVGGFVAIANEDSFPTTNPDINDGAGTIVSIADAGGMTYNTGTGVSTDAQTTGATTVTINSIPASIGSPIPNEYGMLVETTTTLNTYTFHRLVPIATEVTTVASVSSDITTVAGQISPTNNISTVAGISSDIQTLADIQDGTVATNAISNVGNNIGSVTTTASNIASVNNFANVYRISATAPITSLDTGDLYFDTTVNELKVYGASGWQAAGSSVNGTSQRYNYTATNAQTTFTGADNNGNTLTYDAGYIDVYLNGVKLLNGTDVTVTSGSSVVLASGATTGDVVDIVAYGTFSVASLNADNLDSGTVPDARISGAYTGITNLTMSGDLTVDTNTLKVDSTNNRVGIGTTSPSEILHIEGNSPYLVISNTGENVGGIKMYDSGGVATQYFNLTYDSGASNEVSFDTGASGEYTFNVNTAEKMRIDSSGNVGIGTTSPDNILMVSSDGASASAQPLSIVNPSRYGTSDSVELEFGMGRANDTNNLNFPIIGLQKEQQWQGASTNVDASVIFKSVSNQTASERMRITSSGNVGVGTTAPDAKFQSGAITSGSGATVGNQAGFFVGAKSKFASATGLYQNQVCILDTANGAVAGSGGALTFAGYQDADSPTFFATIEGVKNNSTNDNYAGSLRFYTRANGVANMTEGMRIHPDGIVSAPSGIALGIGLSSNSSNVLDDYEEGTWTPASTFANDTASGQAGAYTKVGNMVVATFQIVFSTTSFGVNAALSGLPFTSNSTTGNASGASIGFYNGTSTTLQLYLAENSSQLNLRDIDGDIQHNSAKVTGKTLRGVVVYRAA